MQTYSYYPGCSLHGTAKEFDRSVRLVADKLGLELKEIPDWTCCGASAAHSTNDLLAMALPARNLALASADEHPVLAPCAMCYNRLKVVQHELTDKTKRQSVERAMGMSLLSKGNAKQPFGPEIVSVLQAFESEEMLAAVENAVVTPLNGLKAVCYYGCLLVRPADVLKPDDAENPQSMDKLMAKLGVQVLDWPFKTECCGGSLALARVDIVLSVVHRLLSMARSVGANCIVTACPMCHSNLDTRQGQIKAQLGESFDLPIFYVTELMGLAFGMPAKDLWLDKHLTDAMKVLSE